MKRTLYIFVNGILTNPEDVKGWTDRAVVWINQNTEFKADKMEYKSGLLTRRMYQKARVKNLQSIIKDYHGDKIVLVGHSNGCDIIQRLIQKKTIHVDEVHLIAAASEADFKKNGYNSALKLGVVDKITLYCSPIDRALKKARVSTFLFGWMGLGYGYMGLTGPLNVDPEFKYKVTVHTEEMGHSDWFSKKFFDQTMKRIIGA